MGGFLTQAFEKSSKLPDDLQDQLAQQLLEEIEWESSWDSTLDSSQEKLAQLAEKAMLKYHTDKTKQIGFDDL